MRLRKKAVAVYLVVALFFIFASGISAAPEQSEAIKPCGSLSYGLDVIANTVKVVKTASAGEDITFSAFDFSDALGADVTGVKVLTLPESGVLKLGALDVFAGQSISASMLKRLRFIPEGDSAQFTVSYNDGKGEVKCLLYSVPASATAPVAEQMKLRSYADIPISSKFVCTGEGICEYKVTEQPKHGLLKVGKDGTFVYTPASGYVGGDSFVYFVVDRYGTASKQASVGIYIEKQKSAVRYTDTAGSEAQYAAVLLAERGVFVGESVGELMTFSPSAAVSRIDFLVMTMKSAGYASNIYTATKTGFADESLLSATQKGYVITALAQGLIKGEDYNGVKIWRPNAAITDIEAAEILANIEGTQAASAPTDAPTQMTRAKAAIMLEKILNKSVK